MQNKKDRLRIGAGSSCEEDRLEPAIELCEKGNIDYIVFDSLSEAALSLLTKYKMSDVGKGYDPFTEERLRTILPICARNRIKIIGNMGGKNPKAAQDLAIEIARQSKLKGMKIAAVQGDDVLQMLRELNPKVAETNEEVNEFGENLISAHAYIPVDPIVEALQEEADVVITGRVGDAPMFLAPMIFEFGWKENDWNLKAKGIIIGHLMECAGQVTGGYFPDPPYKVVPDLHLLGFPIAEVYPNGEAVITKVPGSGGVVSPATCTEQLLYETHDPSCYTEADVITDFQDIEFEQVGLDKVKVTGVIKGKPKPECLKVALGVKEGYIAEGMVFYGGPGAVERAKLAADVIKKRLKLRALQDSEFRLDLLGLTALYDSAPGVPQSVSWEVGLRVAGRSKKKSEAIKIWHEFRTIDNNGPAAPGWKARSEGVSEIIGYYSTFIPRDKVSPEFLIKEV